MNDRTEARKHFLTGVELAKFEHEHWVKKLEDPSLRRAFELKNQAWEIAFSSTGDPSQAIALIKEAAKLDSEYDAQVPCVLKHLERKARSGKVSIPNVINIVITSLLNKHGFSLCDGLNPIKNWRSGCWYVRTINNREQIITITHSRISKQMGIPTTLGFHAARQKDTMEYDYLSQGIGSFLVLEFLNQSELETAINHLASIITQIIFPWLESTSSFT